MNVCVCVCVCTCVCVCVWLCVLNVFMQTFVVEFKLFSLMLFLIRPVFCRQLMIIIFFLYLPLIINHYFFSSPKMKTGVIEAGKRSLVTVSLTASRSSRHHKSNQRQQPTRISSGWCVCVCVNVCV